MGIFFDEWQACLRAHYIYVIRTGDAITEPTLRQVLLHSGLSETELEALRAQAEALGPLNSDAPGGAVPAPPPDAAPDDDVIDGVEEIVEIEAALEDGDAAPGVADGSLDGETFDDYDDDGVYGDDEEGDEPPPIAPNQLSLF